LGITDVRTVPQQWNGWWQRGSLRHVIPG